MRFTWMRPILFGGLLAALLRLQGGAAWQEDPWGLVRAGFVPAPARPLLPAVTPLTLDGDRTATLARQALLDPDDAQLRLALGQALLDAHDPLSASVELKKAGMLAPDDPAVAYVTADDDEQTLRTDEALASARRAIAECPGWPEARFRYADLLYRSGHDQEAQKAFLDAFSCPSVPAEVYYEFGNLLLDRGRTAEAVPYFEQSLRWNPGDSYAANNLGNAYKTLHRIADARRCYERAIAADAHNPNPENALGVLLEDQHDWNGALAAFRRAQAIDPHYVEAHYNAGSLLLRRGQLQAAVQELELASELDPSLAIAQLQLSEAYERLGRHQLAASARARAMALDPAHGKGGATHE